MCLCSLLLYKPKNGVYNLIYFKIKKEENVLEGMFYIAIFVLSIIITHTICKSLSFFGTIGGIIKLKLGIWVVVFLCLYVVADAAGIAPETEQKVSLEDEYDEDGGDEYSEEYEDYEDYANYEDYEGYEDNVNKKDGAYILPDSSKKKLDKSDLKGLSKKKLRLARNEIYARHGRIFQDEGLQNYFESKPWYEGIIPAEEFSDSEELSSVERKNIALIKQYESK